MRGKEVDNDIEDVCRRITPAYAGKSITVTCDITAPRDHPRLCGEKLQDTADFTRVAGSPPPMRGKVTGYR